MDFIAKSLPLHTPRPLASLAFSTPDVNGCPKLMTREAFTTAARITRLVFGCRSGSSVPNSTKLVDCIQKMSRMQRRKAGTSKVNWKTIVEFGWNLARWRVESMDRLKKSDSSVPGAPEDHRVPHSNPSETLEPSTLQQDPCGFGISLLASIGCGKTE